MSDTIDAGVGDGQMPIDAKMGEILLLAGARNI